MPSMQAKLLVMIGWKLMRAEVNFDAVASMGERLIYRKQGDLRYTRNPQLRFSHVRDSSSEKMTHAIHKSGR